MKDDKKFHSEVKINTVVWITSLDENQQGVTRRIIEDLDPFLISKDIRFLYHQAVSSKELINYFDYICSEAAKGMLPIIHIDTHGNKQNGLHIAATNENVPWSTIVDKFREININTKNNLCVISLACFSFKVVQEIAITSQTPFYILAAPQDEVEAGYIEDEVMPFYRHVFEKNQLIGAYKANLINKLNLMHSEELLFTTFVKYVRRSCMGKGAKTRVEDLLTEANKMNIFLKNSDLGRFRKIIKRSIKPTQDQLEKFTESFLMGRTVSFKINDVIDKAKKLKADD